MTAPGPEQGGGSPNGDDTMWLMNRAQTAANAVILLILAACGTDRKPESTPSVTDATADWFREIGTASGLDFRHSSSADTAFFMPESMGSGAALFDYDGDGDLDVYLVNSGHHDSPTTSATNRLFRQDQGPSLEPTFLDVTDASGAGDTGFGMGVAVGDVDGNRASDLFISNYGEDRLLLNQGDGSFREATRANGIEGNVWSMSSCFVDIEGDGDLDLFVATYVDYDETRSCTDRAGRPEYCGPSVFPGPPDLFYLNQGDGTFVEAARRTGIAERRSRGLGVACLDLDDDSRPEIYVANDGEENDLWDWEEGRWVNRALVRGVGVNASGAAEASMGVTIGDVDRDLQPDLFLSHLDRETNTLYRSLGGDAGFTDATPGSGLGPSSQQATGFGTALFDLELDGDLDLLVVNGKVRRGRTPSDPAFADPSVRGHWREYAEPNLLFLNDGSARFESAGNAAGALTRRTEVSRGMVTGDLDGDGDLDVLVSNSNGPARLYLNEAPRGGNWIAVRRMTGTRSGTRIQVRAGGRDFAAETHSATSYLSAAEPDARFGLGGAERVESLILEASDISLLRLHNLPVDRTFIVFPEAGG